MRASESKNQEKESTPVNSKEQSQESAALQFIDNRSETVAQQKMQNIAGDNSNPIQTKLITQKGDRSNSSIGAHHPAFKAKYLDSGDTYYANEDALTNSEIWDLDLSMIMPKVYLIGEAHSDSKFNDIWGHYKWVAQGISEQYAERDEEEQEHFWPDAVKPGEEVNAGTAGVKALESTHTKTLSYVALALKISKDAKAKAQSAWETDYNHTKHIYNILGWMLGNLNYYGTLKKGDTQLFGLSAFVSMEDQSWYQAIVSAYDRLIDINANGTAVSLRTAISTAFQTKNTGAMWTALKADSAVTYFQQNLVAINTLNVAIPKDSVLKQKRTEMGDKLMDNASKGADSVDNTLAAVRPTRDLEMAKKIDGASLPSIVRAGRNHVPGIMANVSNKGRVKAYTDYKDFYKDTNYKL